MVPQKTWNQLFIARLANRLPGFSLGKKEEAAVTCSDLWGPKPV
jgi:hypothetical protein